MAHSGERQVASGGAGASAGSQPAEPEDTTAGPEQAEVGAWAAAEQKRREAWLDGPSGEERAAWAAAEQRRREAEVPHRDGPASPAATDEEVEAWADGERKRRQAWLNGPTEAEKLAWVRRQRRIRALGIPSLEHVLHGDEEALMASARRVQHDVLLAGFGLAELMVTVPLRLWDTLVAAGREWEEQDARPLHRRVRL